MTNNFAQQWLDVLCRIVPETNAAMFMTLDENSKTMRPMAKWPENLCDVSEFTQIVNYAMTKTEQVSIFNVGQPNHQHCDFFALPIFVQSELIGIIVLKTAHLPTNHHETIFRTLQQGSQWLELARLKPSNNEEFYNTVVGILVACFEKASYREALIGLAAELTRTLDCDRVAISEYQDHRSNVVALSNSAQFDVRSNLMQIIADAMDEAIEQDSVIIYPNTQSTTIDRIHQELARKFESSSLFTIPMYDGANIFGAITLLRSDEKPFDAEKIKLCEQTMALATLFLALKKADELPLRTKIITKAKQSLSNLIGYKNLKLKLAVGGFAVFVLMAGLLKGDFRLTADAILEGKMQRVVAAPIAGFLVSASVRAGDNVHKGDVMATLDDSELKLDLTRLSGQLQKFRREYREALSTGDLVKVRVVSAQIDQATAEMELTQQQLQKITLTAPFDSVVIEGDLSQLLGSPVERGDTLFKIAPLEGYRIILNVNERLISYVQVGQQGTLALASIPDNNFQLTVQKITAVAKADNGENLFRVEASLDNAPALLRPGMEGVGKINAGRARLLWIWTHEMIDWLRLWFWSWWL